MSVLVLCVLYIHKLVVVSCMVLCVCILCMHKLVASYSTVPRICWKRLHACVRFGTHLLRSSSFLLLERMHSLCRSHCVLCIRLPVEAYTYTCILFLWRSLPASTHRYGISGLACMHGTWNACSRAAVRCVWGFLARIYVALLTRVNWLPNQCV